MNLKTTLTAATLGLGLGLSAAQAETVLTVPSWVPQTHFIYTDILVPYAQSIVTATEGRVTLICPLLYCPFAVTNGCRLAPFLCFVVGAGAAFGRSWPDASGPFGQIIGTTLLPPRKKISDRFPRPRPSVLISHPAAARSRRARLMVSTDVARASAKVSVPGAQCAVSWCENCVARTWARSRAIGDRSGSPVIALSHPQRAQFQLPF